jgi:hypothetical protein
MICRVQNILPRVFYRPPNKKFICRELPGAKARTPGKEIVKKIIKSLPGVNVRAPGKEIVEKKIFAGRVLSKHSAKKI